MYPFTFVSASPPIRTLLLPTSIPASVTSSNNTPLMIAAPKRRGRPPKHTASSISSRPSPSHHSSVRDTIDIICEHQDHTNAEQAALAMLEEKPHLLADERSHTLSAKTSSKANSSLTKTRRKRPPANRHRLVARPNAKPSVSPIPCESQLTSQSPNSRQLSASHSTQPPHFSRSLLRQSDPVGKVNRLNTAGDAYPPVMNSDDVSTHESDIPASESRKEPAWTSNSSADNTVRWYLQLIGGDRLLRPEEEVELGRQIRDLMSWQRKLVELADTIGREPTVEEWAEYLNEDPTQFKKKLFEARRAKDRMVVCNLRLVVSIAKRYLNRGMPLSDLIQEGTLGLIRACEKFDAEKGFKFSTYATWWVRQAVSRSIADQSRTIRLPVHLYDTITAIRRATKYLTNELGRPPLEQEIADYCDITVDKLRVTRVNMQAAMPLDCPLSATDDALTLSDVIESDEESPEDRVESSLLRDDLEHVVNSLTPRERDVVRMRYGLDDGRAKTLEEIGRVFDVTKERVRQIESKALRKLRHPYRSAVLREYTPPES